MDKSKKTYAKALDKYNNGYIDKAIELCEESISIDINNTASINLKGLLYYLKGDLDSSRRLWKMNYQVNKDGVSEKYLKDTQKDLERKNKFEESVKYIKELKINDALKLLEECSRSDYNAINVNNYKALCYIKRGEFDKAQICIEKVHKIDKKNKFAKNNITTLRKFGVKVKTSSNKKMIYSIMVSIFIIAIVTSSIYVVKSVNFKHLFYKTNTNKSTNEKKTVEKPKQQPKKEIVQKQEAFPQDKVKKDLEAKNFDELYVNLFKWKDKNISVNDKSLLASVDELLREEGVEYFYNRGNAFISNKDYENAKENLLKAYNLGSNHYLYPHIIYILATSFEALNDIENAIKYYTQYDSSYPKGDYEEIVLYNLANIYKNIDKEKAKGYAQKLIDEYSSSIYNNSIINSILSS